jgi:hypothetical protein
MINCASLLVSSPIGQSDHNSLIFVLKKTRAKNKITKLSKRNLNEANKAAVGKWLSEINWSSLYRLDNCEQKLAIFQNILKID